MAGPKWLKDLQGSVQGAVKEIAKLRRQNKSLKTQLDNAKSKLAQAEVAAAEAGPDPEVDAWRTERKEVRRRVARLSKTLEDLV
jgi:predicted  nucleic acid-binding Zn-ribbon protein